MFSETPFHAENRTWRARTGSAYNFPGAYGIPASGSAFPTKGTIPSPQAKVGTILSTGVNVRGTSTRFTVDIYEGDYIYSKDVVRQVKAVISDTLLVLVQPFPTDISVAVTPLVCRNQYFKAIYASNVHASADAVVQEAPLAAGKPVLNGGSVISYDATGSTLEFTCSQ